MCTKRRIGFSGFALGTVMSTSLLVASGCGSNANNNPQTQPRPSAERAPEQGRASETGASAVPSGGTTQTARTRQRSLSRGAVNARVMPLRISVDGAATDAGLALMDGRADTGLTGERGDYVIRITLPSAHAIAGLAVVGSAGTLQLLHDVEQNASAPAAAGPTLIGPALTLTGDRRWNRVTFEGSQPYSELSLRWHGTHPEDRLAEIEIWSPDRAQEHLSGTLLHDEIAADTLDAPTFLSPTSAMVINAPNRLHDTNNGTFVVDVANAAACRRAFLRYTLEGVRSWTALTRKFNDRLVPAAAVAEASTERTVQVEELPPRLLRTGTNRVQFEPLQSALVREYTVDQLSIVCVSDMARRFDDQPLDPEQLRRLHSVQDGIATTGLSLNGRSQRIADLPALQWNFGVPTQLHEVSLLLDRPFRGSLTVTARGGVRESNVRIPLVNLQAGWNHVHVPEALAEGSTFAVQPSASRGETDPSIGEIVLSGSPVPADAEPHRIVLVAPTATSCLSNSVSLRGFVDAGVSQVRTLRVLLDGVERQVLTEQDHSFALSLQVGSAAPTHRLALEALLDNGERVSSHGEFEHCRATPAPQTTQGQLREDVAAPFAQWVHPDRAATLSFGEARLEVESGSVAQSTRITMRSLDSALVPALEPGMTNVTRGARAYRFGPHGMHFSKPVRLLFAAL